MQTDDLILCSDLHSSGLQIQIIHKHAHAKGMKEKDKHLAQVAWNAEAHIYDRHCYKMEHIYSI